jgi:hypothetical protein
MTKNKKRERFIHPRSIEAAGKWPCIGCRGGVAADAVTAA